MKSKLLILTSFFTLVVLWGCSKNTQTDNAQAENTPIAEQNNSIVDVFMSETTDLTVVTEENVNEADEIFADSKYIWSEPDNLMMDMERTFETIIDTSIYEAYQLFRDDFMSIESYDMKVLSDGLPKEDSTYLVLDNQGSIEVEVKYIKNGENDIWLAELWFAGGVTTYSFISKGSETIVRVCYSAD